MWRRVNLGVDLWGGKMYKVMIADCPWSFGDSLPGDTRGAVKQYNCLSVQDLMYFQLPELEDDCLLGFWRVASMQQEALDVLKAWGFIVKSEVVWEKLTKHGKPWFGMGSYVRASHETALIATKGRFKVADRSIRSRFSAPVPTGADGKYIHSAKPIEFHSIMQRLAGECGVELFARHHVPGWTCLGDQLGSLT
jgi:N6-adenosine-specific RNA methylase IME4